MPDTPPNSRLRALFAHPAATAVLALVMVLAIGLVFHGDGAFYKWGTHRDALRQASVAGILACGMTVIIITGGIDLAVGSMLALVAVVFSLATIHWTWSPWLAIPMCLALGAACGAGSGAIISLGRIQPFVATLATMVLARGLAKSVSGGFKISQSFERPDGTFEYLPLPPLFEAIDSRYFGGNIAVVTIVFLVAVAATWLLLSRLRLGRHLYAIGGNEEAARLSGIRVNTVKTLAYAWSGLLAAVAGICQAAQERQGDPEAGTGYELTAIAIVVIGGTSLMGGRGGVGLTLLGTLIIGYIEKILSINAVETASRLMLTGAIIIVAVLLQRRRR